VEPKIVAFIGAGCVGKTTLLDEYRRRFDGDHRIAFADEAAKQYFASHQMPEELRFTAPVQGEIQAMAMAAEQEACRRGQLVLADRSTLDYPIYVSAIGDAEGAAALLKRARPWARMYRHLYLLDPSGVPFEQTAERQEDEVMRQVLHDEFLRFLAVHDIPYTLLSGTVETRIRAVDVELRKILS
jgi:nicotinamide riboside kinase